VQKQNTVLANDEFYLKNGKKATNLVGHKPEST